RGQRGGRDAGHGGAGTAQRARARRAPIPSIAQPASGGEEMKRLIAVLAMMLACAGAAAQQPQPANAKAHALELAKKLGGEQSADGLETIIKTGNTDLLHAYVSGFHDAGIRSYTQQGNKTVAMPKEVEAVVLSHYGDDVVAPILWGLTSDNSLRIDS